MHGKKNHDIQAFAAPIGRGSIKNTHPPCPLSFQKRGRKEPGDGRKYKGRG